MEDIILVIYVRDAEYGKRLLHFLASKKNPKLQLELATEKNKVEYRVGTEHHEIVILTDRDDVGEGQENAKKKGGKDTTKKRILYLTNQQDREQGRIFQFQKAENIYRELVWQLKLEEEKVPIDVTETKDETRGVFAVISPGGGGTTVISAMLAQYLGTHGNCLYLCMTGFPVYYEGELTSEWNMQSMGLGELMFALEQKGFISKEKELRQSFGRAFMLPPATHFKDVLDCAGEDWGKFLAKLRGECSYDSIVIELGLLYEYTFDILELCDMIFLLKEGGLQGKIRREIYERYCEMEGKRGVVGKTICVSISDKLNDWERDLELESLENLADNPQKMAYVKNLLKGEDEDVCILEDDG